MMFLRISLRAYFILVSITLFTAPFEFYIYYLFILPVVLFNIGKISFSRIELLLLIFVIIWGSISVLLELNTLTTFTKSLLVSLLHIAYFKIVLTFGGVKLIRDAYLESVKIVVFIGVVQFSAMLLGITSLYDYSWVLNKWWLSPGIVENLYAINSVFQEPTHLVVFLTPGLVFAIATLMGDGSGLMSRRFSFTLLFVFLISNSVTGLVIATLVYIRFFLSVRLDKKLYISIFVASLIIPVLFSAKSVERFNSVTTLLEDNSRIEVGEADLSSLILFDNLNIALNSMKISVVGSGLGSHPISYEKYSKLNSTRDLEIIGGKGNNKDALSLGIRLISEFGVIGVAILLVLIGGWLNMVPRKNLLRFAFLTGVMSFILRQGNYNVLGFWPFLFIGISKKYNDNIH